MHCLTARVVLILGVLCAAASAAHGQTTLDEIVHRAKAGFLGRVESVNSRWGDASRSWMETDYVFTVDEVIVDDGRLAAGRKLTLTTWGGKIGDRRHYRVSQPALAKGERYILMLNEHYAEAENLSPLVRFNEGFFTVAKSADNEGEIVVDRFGEPVVALGESKAVHSFEARQRKASGEPLTPAQLVSMLRSDLKRIKALIFPDARPRAARDDGKSLARPQGASRPAANLAARELKQPEAGALQGFAAPVAPRTLHAAIGGDKAVAQSHEPMRGAPKFATTIPSKLPMAFNILPKTDEFAPWADVDEFCLWTWGQYFPEMLKIYAQPLDNVAYENGVNDIHGFLNDAELYNRFGIRSWDDQVFTVVVVEQGGLTREADIAFNSALPFTLDDEAVYAGESNDLCFRRYMMQAIGCAVGLEQSNFPSLMAVPNQIAWDGLHYPMHDDLNGLQSLYPKLRKTRSQDLIIHLLSSPGGGDWLQSTFPDEVAAGGEMTVGMYLLENGGTAAAPQPKVDWYLCQSRNWDDAYIYLGRSTYSALPAGQFFITNEKLNIKLTVPADAAAGDYYLGAFLRDDPDFADATFPFNSNSAFSQTRIKVTATP